MRQDLKNIGRMRTFFTTNPCEFLTIEDAMVKFGLTKVQATNAIRTLARRRVISFAHVYFKTPPDAGATA